MEKDPTVLIVGGGLAGWLTAFHLVRQGASVHMVREPMDFKGIPGAAPDNGYMPASLAAAGVINPVVLKRLAPAWKVAIFLAYARYLYDHLHERTGNSLFKPCKIHRWLSSSEMVQFWRNRALDPQNGAWMEPEPERWPANDAVRTGIIWDGAWIRPELLFKALEELLKDEITDLGTVDLFGNKALEFNNIRPNYKAVIFTQGAGIHKNPLLRHIPVTYSFGDLALSNHIPPDHIVHNGLFWLSDGHGRSMIGSSFINAGPMVHNPPNEAAQLVAQVNAWPGVSSASLTGRRSGIRVKTPDRRPLCGPIAGHKGCYVLNGLGSRGYTYAPLLSLMLSHLVLGLPPDVPDQSRATDPSGASRYPSPDPAAWKEILVAVDPQRFQARIKSS